MKHTVQQIVEEGPQRAVNMRGLPTLMAVPTNQRSPTIEARCFVGVTISAAFTVLRFNRARGQCAGSQFADNFTIAHAWTPIASFMLLQADFGQAMQLFT